MATPTPPKGTLVGWIVVSRWKGEPWVLTHTDLLTREEASRRLRLHTAGASQGRETKRARVVLED